MLADSQAIGMYDAASCEKRGDVAEVPPQRLRRIVIRRVRCMTWGRFVDHVTQELVSAASPMVAMIDGMMSFVHDVRCWR